MEFKARAAARFLGDEIQEVPLRHQGDVWRVNGQVGQVGNGYSEITELTEKLKYLLVWQLKKPVEQTEFMHHLHGRGMNGIAAKIAQKVGMLFQYDDRAAGTRQQQCEHQAGRPASDDAAVV